MQRLQIYINDKWQELDLPEDKVALTLQTNDIAELKDRQASYSQSIKLPKTPNNERIFAFAFDLQTQNKVPYAFYDCHLFINDINVLGWESVLYINEVEQDSINIQILGSNGGLLAKMQDTLISDLDFDDLGTIQKRETKNNYRKNQVMIRSFDCFTAFNEDNNKYNKGFWYFVNFYDVIKRLLLIFGYTLDDDVKQEDRNNVYISLQNLTATNPDSLPNIETREFKTGTFTLTYNRNRGAYKYFSLPFAPSTITSNTLLKYKAMLPAGNSFNYLDDVPYFTCYEYSADYKGQIRIKMHFEGRWIHSFAMNKHVCLSIYKNNTYYYHTQADNNSVSIDVDQTIDVEQNDKIQITGWYYIKHPSATLSSDSKFETSTTSNNYISVEVLQADSVPLLGTIATRDNLPNFKTCYDILKAFANIFALTLNIDARNKKLYCYTIQTLYDNIPKAKDWSQKLLKDDFNLSFNFGSYGQKNYLKFKDNDTITNSATFDINNQTLDKEKDVVSFDFYAGDLVTFNNKRLPYIQAFDMDENNKLTLKESKAYILKEILTDAPLIFLPAIYLLNNYYNRLAYSILQQTRVLELYFDLKDTDIQEFDFSIPIYLEQTGRYYYVNKISNYISGQKAKATLIQL